MSESPFPSMPGGVCAAAGFRSHAVACGIKKPDSPKRDLVLIASDRPCAAAGTFTRNLIQAAPVLVSRDHLERGRPRAIVANSGNANAATGETGMGHAREMARLGAATLGLAETDVLVASTGIIGLPLPMERIRPRFESLAAGLQAEHCDAAAEGIMTSDTRPKIFAVDAGGFRVGGIAKGAGMIRPDMATMLAFLTSDAEIEPDALRRMTREVVDETFNCITIDGDMSTNDTVIVLANGAAGPADPDRFRDALRQVMLELAILIVGDGERVTKLVEVHVQGAADEGEARLVAGAVANSNLVKASWNGEDPNWGRIIHAIGHATSVRLDPGAIDIFFGDLPAARNGVTAAETRLEDLIEVVRARRFRITIDLHVGTGAATVYSSDLSPEYVDFNRADYALANRA